MRTESTYPQSAGRARPRFSPPPSRSTADNPLHYTTDDPSPKPTTTPQPPQPRGRFALAPPHRPRPACVPLFFAFTPEPSEAHLHPVELFPGLDSVHPAFPTETRRFRHSKNAMWALIQTDGACACPSNGRETQEQQQKAAWGMCWGPELRGVPGSSAGMLEGPREKHTSQRAELRAFLAALYLRYWPGEGTSHLVIATDSEYVAKGCTESLPVWVGNGWKNTRGQPVANQDLWRRVVARMEDHFGDALRVGLWRVDRELNRRADKLANDMARSDEAAPPGEFSPVRGVML
ncbi:hypothetical protein JCM1840_004568 [Sporobolomyces johnsonii]